MSKESTERIEQRAGDWLARRDSDSWSEREQAAFDRWIGESIAHRVAYLRLDNVWENASRLKALGAGIHSDKPPPPGQWNLSPFFTQRAEGDDSIESVDLSLLELKRGPRARARPHIRALAASLILAVTAASGWYLWPAGNSYETPVGGVASLPMPDGSKVILNTNSEIKVAINDTERRIDLKHGEAFFDVAKDPNRPFTVIAGNKRITAIGTAFSVRRDKQDVQVVVTEGSVRVESSDVPLATTGEGTKTMVPTEKGLGARVLTAGAVARTNKDGLMVQTKKLPEAEEQLAWRSGGLVFRDVSLADAVAEFNRYNTRKIFIEDPVAAAFTVGGNFRTTNVDAFVRLLEQGYPVRADFQQDKITLTAR